MDTLHTLTERTVTHLHLSNTNFWLLLAGGCLLLVLASSAWHAETPRYIQTLDASARARVLRHYSPTLDGPAAPSSEASI